MSGRLVQIGREFKSRPEAKSQLTLWLFYDNGEFDDIGAGEDSCFEPEWLIFIREPAGQRWCPTFCMEQAIRTDRKA